MGVYIYESVPLPERGCPRRLLSQTRRALRNKRPRWRLAGKVAPAKGTSDAQRRSLGYYRRSVLSHLRYAARSRAEVLSQVRPTCTCHFDSAICRATFVGRDQPPCRRKTGGKPALRCDRTEFPGHDLRLYHRCPIQFADGREVRSIRTNSRHLDCCDPPDARRKELGSHRCDGRHRLVGGRRTDYASVSQVRCPVRHAWTVLDFFRAAALRGIPAVPAGEQRLVQVGLRSCFS